MNTGDLIKMIALELEMTHDEAKRVVYSFIEALKRIILEKNRIEIRNFGVFEKKRRKEKRVYDFKNKKFIKIPPYFSIRFKPSSSWRP